MSTPRVGANSPSLRTYGVNSPSLRTYRANSPTAIRQEHAQGDISITKLAKKHGITAVYCSQLIHGGARQTANPRRPIVACGSPKEILQHPSGATFPRRSSQRRRFVRQIPWDTIVNIRHEHAMNGAPPIDLAVKYGVSASHVWKILKRQVRKTA
jgi:hypothetical protein